MKIDFKKNPDGLIPAIIQDATSKNVLMLGYMNQEAFENPIGPTCHKGSDTCWNDTNNESYGFISKLEETIANRIENADASKSYVASLFKKGINKVAQKVGEEAVEVVIEAKDTNDTLFLNESADLLFHYLLLLQAKGFTLNDVVEVLKGREK